MGKARRGQSMVEFVIAVPVFLLLLFGIFQAVLIYKAQLALNQAASDAAQVISAQSSDGAPGNPLYTNPDLQADTPALAAIRAALSTMDLRNLSDVCLDGTSPPCSGGNSAAGIDIYSDDGSGNPANILVNNSHDLSAAFDSMHDSGAGSACPPVANPAFECVTLDNHYVYQQNSSTCPVDLDQNGNYNFSLTDQLSNSPQSSSIVSEPASPPNTWVGCALPWNGHIFNISASGNQNGRDDQRCQEQTVTVKIRYNYASASFPIHWGIQLVGTASDPLEPRQYIGNSAVVQSTVGTC